MRLPFPIVVLVFGGSTLLASSPTAHAQILYTFSSTIAHSSGPDRGGLSHGTALISFTVPDGATYVALSGIPAVPVLNAQLTIAGAQVAIDNGTYALGNIAYYPTLAGFSSSPYTDFLSVNLPDGNTFQYRGPINSTSTGSSVHVGDLVTPDQLAPTTPNGVFFDTDQTIYLALNPTITASRVFLATPEPGAWSLFLSGLGLGMTTCLRRRRKARSSH